MYNLTDGAEYPLLYCTTLASSGLDEPFTVCGGHFHPTLRCSLNVAF